MTHKPIWLLCLTCLFAPAAWSAGPKLSPDQIQAAIREGSKYKSGDQFLEKGLKGKKIKLAGAMAKDGISKYATFFNDWQAVAGTAAVAQQQMRELKPDQIESTGLLHVFVEVRGGGIVGSSRVDKRFARDKAHMVLKIGERIVQPVEKSMVRQANDAGATMAWAAVGGLGVGMKKIALEFVFDVTPEDLDGPVTAILIDGDGNRHSKDAELKGILSLP